MEKYDHKVVEAKQQKKWWEADIDKVGTDPNKPKAYILDMFPYLSGEGLHVGHPKGYIATDVYSRLKKMQGYNILHPMGWDAFGLPAENYAIKNKIYPPVAVERNIKHFKEQLKKIGFNYDWEREINTTDPEYYKWTQWIFLKLLEKGLAYESFEPINWCPSCQTGLANEDLENGRCERCGSEVIKKPMRQWVLKITDYADRLLKDLDDTGLNWPEYIKESQRNWIGRSEGAEIEFEIISPTPSPLPKREGDDQDDELSPWGRAGRGFMTADKKLWPILQEKALEMRQNPTPAEERLWQELRDHKLGCHFRRQHIVGKFIVDFICLEKSLIVEVDGDIHDLQQEADRERSDYLESVGFKVVRFKNEEVIDNLNSVTLRIKGALPLGEGWGGAIKIFTTRPDTIYGATFMAVSPEVAGKWLEAGWSPDRKVKKYITATLAARAKQTYKDNPGKTGVFAGFYAENPANHEQIPVWITNYVLGDIGTGAIMAVPAHDERDFDFAKKFNLPISDTGLVDPDEAIKKVGGQKAVRYKLKDWVFSRQRYWGEPIPIVHCEKCGVVPVPEKDLPVKLPEVEHYEPAGTGESPLATITDWVNTTCPKCGGPAKRETNTMPQWAGSCWYYLAYCIKDPKAKSYNLKAKSSIDYWNPVDVYVGGAEHATRHLIYARFWHKFLYDIGVVSNLEPFIELHNVGLILAEDGRKMSKRYGNTVDPSDIVDLYGADSLRLYTMFMGPFSDEIAWQTKSIIGVRRFLEKVWRLRDKVKGEGESDPNLNLTAQKVTADILGFRFNTAISTLMIQVNTWEKLPAIPQADFETLLKLLAPFAPHLADELWESLGHPESIHLAKWPEYDITKAKPKTITIAVQVNGRARGVVIVPADSEEEAVKQVILADSQLSKWLTREPQQVIFVKNRIINLLI